MLKKILCIAFTLVCVSSLTVSAFATEPAAMDELISPVESVTRGTSIPKKEWDLTEKSYPGKFTGLRTGLYTDYFFTGVTSLKVSWSALENTGPATSTGSNDDATLLVRLYDITTSSWVAAGEYETASMPYPELKTHTGSHLVQGLNSSHKYAFHFKNGISDSDSQLSANITVSKG